jgi:5-methylcytosine-specific restriction endonuclease McrA
MSRRRRYWFEGLRQYLLASPILAEAQGHICARCGLRMIPASRSLDHVMPLNLGGRDALGNVVCMHFLCNQEKDAKLPRGCDLIWLFAVNARIGVHPQFVDDEV